MVLHHARVAQTNFKFQRQERAWKAQSSPYLPQRCSQNSISSRAAEQGINGIPAGARGSLPPSPRFPLPLGHGSGAPRSFYTSQPRALHASAKHPNPSVLLRGRAASPLPAPIADPYAAPPRGLAARAAQRAARPPAPPHSESWGRRSKSTSAPKPKEQGGEGRGEGSLDLAFRAGKPEFRAHRLRIEQVELASRGASALKKRNIYTLRSPVFIIS